MYDEEELVFDNYTLASADKTTNFVATTDGSKRDVRFDRAFHHSRYDAEAAT